MNIRKFQLGPMVLVAMQMGLVNQAMASGYEKSILWGARSAGVGGVTTPYISGSQAVVFNPAGLVGEQGSRDLSVEFSPTMTQFKGPINNANDVETSKQSLLPIFGMTYGATVNEKVGWGLGVYVAGGAKATYEGVPFTGFASTADVKTDLTITEIALGAGYKVDDRLKLGVAWRVAMAQATFSVVNRVSATAFLNPQLSNLKDTRYDGFKLGAQYKLDEKTMLGFSYRSELNLQATGDIGGQLVTTTTTLPVTPTSGTVKTTFPMQITLGAQHNLNEAWRLYGEYVWTQYSRVGDIEIDGTIAVPAANVSVSNSKVQQQWKDQHNVRLAGEYVSTPWPVRFGYVWTSQVTNSDWARATFTPPGAAHTFTLGTGQTFTVQEKPLQFDVAGEYTTVSGDTGTPGSNDIRPGTHSATAYALHAGVTYHF